MQILIIDEKNKPRELFELYIEQIPNIQLLVQEDFTGTKGLLELFDDIGLIICSEIIGKEQTAAKLIEHLKAEGITQNTKLLVISSESSFNDSFIEVISPTISPTELKKKCESLLSNQPAKEEPVKTKEVKYKKFPIRILEYLCETPVTIYIKESIKDEFKFRVVFEKDARYEQSELRRVYQFKQDYMYIKEEDYSTFVKEVNLRMLSLVSQRDLETKTKAEIDQIIYEYLSDVGIQPAVIKVTESNMTNILNSFEENKNLKELLSGIFKKGYGFKYQWNMMTSVIALAILDKQSWATKQQKEAVTMACFLKDILLHDIEHLQVSTEIQFNSSFFDKKDQDLIYNHAIETANKLKSQKHIPESVISIIKHHHGSIGGQGFYNNLPSQVGQIERVLIIAELFSLKIMMAGSGKVKATSFIKEIDEYFAGSQVTKLLETLKSCLT